MPYPPGWRRVASDRGAASAALLDARGHYLGYLNLTPRQGNETLADWPRFRPDHNRDEGDRDVRTLATATGLRFRTGRGSCVEDSYSTITGAQYTEFACLVAGRRASSVIVGAGATGAWGSVAGLLERAIAALRT